MLINYTHVIGSTHVLTFALWSSKMGPPWGSIWRHSQNHRLPSPSDPESPPFPAAQGSIKIGRFHGSQHHNCMLRLFFLHCYLHTFYPHLTRSLYRVLSFLRCIFCMDICTTRYGNPLYLFPTRLCLILMSRDWLYSMWPTANILRHYNSSELGRVTMFVGLLSFLKREFLHQALNPGLFRKRNTILCILHVSNGPATDRDPILDQGD